MTAENRHTRNEKLMEGADTDTSNRIIPTPFRVEVGDAAQTFDVFGVSLINANLLGKMQSGAEELISKITMKPTSTNEYNVELAIGTLPQDITGPESYQMEIKAGGTTITASHAEGLFYGVMSFLGLLELSDEGNGMPVKEMTIHDKPRFDYRGHQIDSARNFRTKESVMQTIDAMALYKLNNLHFGLSNDEGWRLEIPGMEELTTVGSRRCFDQSEESCILTQLGSGPDASEEPQFYSVADYVEILKYADARNVKVAPEFNMPGHARAAVVSMEARAKKGDDSYRLMDPEDETELLTVQFYDRSSIINPCLDSSVMFVEKLVDEVVKMYGEAQLSLDMWQFGGDEAKNILLGGGYSAYDLPKEAPFSKSPACIKKMQEDPTINVDTDAANYWALKVNQILKQKGIREMLAWEDGLNGMTKEEFEIDEVSVNFWSTLFWGGTDGLVQTSKTGFGIIMANPDYLYFDFPYEVHPEERGYYWAARENSVAKVFSFAPENLPQNAETSLDRDGNSMDVTTPDSSAPVIKGMQGQTWSETVRTETQHQEMTFPRVLAVAERAWHRGSWELDWTPNQNYQGTTNHVPKDQLAADFKGFN
ncbi:family 20 glycosylhydrolase, partial [Roseibium sp.]|uniref:family 20 glycosylhydrolase n=1 Tax=Roseibium sp. TaxID=1936156 RepID=UPI0039189CC2